MSRKIVLVLILSLSTVHGCLAQTTDHYLERLLAHTRSMESKLEAAELGSQFQGDLQRLAVDVEKWRRRFLEEEAINEVREQLHGHEQMLRASALNVSLDTDQRTTLDLLLMELDLTSQNLTPEHFDQKLITIPVEISSSNRKRVHRVTHWGGLPDTWDTLLCPPDIDLWGPYFGRPMYPNPGALWW